MDKNFKIYTIIITYNGEKLIRRCLNSLKQSTISTDIIVIDNASGDRTTEIIEKEFPQVRLIKNKKNIGFGRANNIGLKIALEEKADYVVLLNQDTEILPDTLEEVIKIAKQNPEIGILSPLQLDKHHRPARLVYHWFLKSNPAFFDDVISGNLKSFYEVDFVSASFWLLPRRTLERVGGFNPVFFMYGEDTEYCLRTQGKGLKIATVISKYYIHYKENFYKKNFWRRILEKRNFVIENISNFNYSFISNLKASLKYIYIEIVKNIAIFKFKEALIFLLTLIWVFFSIIKIYRTFLYIKNHNCCLFLN